MANELPQYYVVKCIDCKICFGKHKKSKLLCPHCGKLQINPQIVNRTNNTDNLSKLVSINNMPEELRKEFDNVKKDGQNAIQVDDLIKNIPEILQEASNIEGLVFFENLKKLLAKKNLNSDVEKIIEMGEVEGLLLRISEEKWQLLG